MWLMCTHDMHVELDENACMYAWYAMTEYVSVYGWHEDMECMLN